MDWSQRRVVVTGGAGFIGSHLVEMLLERGARVRVPVREGSLSRGFLADVLDQVDVVRGDLDDPVFARSVLDGQEALFHLAARVGGIHYNMAHPASIFTDNIRPFLNVLEAARHEELERVLVTSSACVYPRDCSIPTPEIEGFKDRPEPTNEGYGWAKRMEEYLAEAAVAEWGMCVKVARPYNAYGPRDDFDPASSHVIPALIRRVVEGDDPLEVWGDGSATRCFLYATDFARGLIRTMEDGPDGVPINIGGDEETSIRELVETIVEVAGVGCEVRFDPSKPAGQPRRACDGSRARELLGFRAEVPLREGLARTVEWYRAQLSRKEEAPL